MAEASKRVCNMHFVSIKSSGKLAVKERFYEWQVVSMVHECTEGICALFDKQCA